jgi:hypothetical protein
LVLFGFAGARAEKVIGGLADGERYTDRAEYAKGCP